jgi:hypothetical protein
MGLPYRTRTRSLYESHTGRTRLRGLDIPQASMWTQRGRRDNEETTPTQLQCLRAVAGAYRRTPVRSLETETFVSPLDIYLNKRLADFEARLEATGKWELIHGVYVAIAR